jgi:hypothetical protein
VTASGGIAISINTDLEELLTSTCVELSNDCVTWQKCALFERHEDSGITACKKNNYREPLFHML